MGFGFGALGVKLRGVCSGAGRLAAPTFQQGFSLWQEGGVVRYIHHSSHFCSQARLVYSADPFVILTCILAAAPSLQLKASYATMHRAIKVSSSMLQVAEYDETYF